MDGGGELGEVGLLEDGVVVDSVVVRVEDFCVVGGLVVENFA